MSRLSTWGAAVAALTVITLSVMPGAGATAGVALTRCPSAGTPAPGSTIAGGLEVDGFCTLTDVTVNGGLNVDPSFALTNGAFLNGTSVNGGLVVGAGSGFTTGWDLETGNLTHDHSTINGGISTTDLGALVVADTTIRGGFTMNGGFDWSLVCGHDPDCFSLAPVCGSEVWGNVTLRNVNTNEVFIGDPGEPLFPNGDCAGNMIHGSISVENTNFVSAHNEPTEIEGNTVTGSVHLSHSTAEVYGNTIGGSLLCTYGSVIFPAPPGDPSGTTNAISGTDTCF